MKANQFSYMTDNCHIIHGWFNIVQSRSGHIYIQLGNLSTRLLKKQIEDLSIDMFGLEDFDFDLYKKAYKES